MNLKARALLSATFALAIILFLVLRPGSPQDPQPERTKVADAGPPPDSTQPLSAIPNAKPENDPPGEGEEPPAFDPYEEWQSDAILRAFMVPPGDFTGADIGAVVRRLGEIYRQHGGKNIEFRIEGGTQLPAFPVEFAHENISFQRLMELAAGLAGYEVEVGDGEVLFKAGLPLAAAGTELQTLLSSEHEPNSTATDGLDPDRLNQADLDELRERFVGTSLPVKATLAGLDRVRLSGAAELSSSPDPAQLQATDYTGELTDGDTTTLAVGENKGKSTYEFITVRRLAADGSPLLP